MPGQPFDLRITFTGLCLYVPDLNPAKRRLHVLLPKENGSGGEIPKHESVLMWHRNYAAAADARQPGAWRTVPLSGKWVLDGPDTGLDLGLTRKLIHLKDACGEGGVDPDKAEPELTAWIVLDAGHMLPGAWGACWQVPKDAEPQELTHQIDWYIWNFGTDKLDGQKLESLTGTPATTLPTLLPKNGLIHMHLFHVPPGERPPDPSNPGTPTAKHPYTAKHFGAYYRLLAKQPAREPLPWLHTRTLPTHDKGCRDLPKGTGSAPAGGSSEVGGYGGDPFRCMSGQATLV